MAEITVGEKLGFLYKKVKIDHSIKVQLDGHDLVGSKCSTSGETCLNGLLVIDGDQANKFAEIPVSRSCGKCVRCF